MSLYTKTPHPGNKRNANYKPSDKNEVKLGLKHRLPGNIILVHGVNDIGTSYEAMEQGLCEGLTERIDRGATPAKYRMPNEADRKKVIADPDAVFYKRTVDEDTYSPVIPFYWGFREIDEQARKENGQHVDRHGNRLDKDLSSGGGPFANATSSLPDMWNCGIELPIREMGDDPIRPLRSTPGRMYMILAAQRLAALISMIRDYDKNETVSIVAHSQGCLISLLAQIFLLERKLQPADTLILNNPPYSLDDSLDFMMGKARTWTQSDQAKYTDASMLPHYHLIEKQQTLRARLQTLVNIVHQVGIHGVAQEAKLPFTSLPKAQHQGIVGPNWKAAADRDNRGKVYLYFSPEDMTVALKTIKGIGWQGVPDYIDGRETVNVRHNLGDPCQSCGSIVIRESKTITLKPMEKLAPYFFQRVFTEKTRINPVNGEPQVEKVGLKPHDFVLRIKGENDKGHVTKSGRGNRENLPTAVWSPSSKTGVSEQQKRYGIRAINGEALRKPVLAELRGAGHINADSPVLAEKSGGNSDGPMERIDPVDASTATTTAKGRGVFWIYREVKDEEMPFDRNSNYTMSPAPELFSGFVQEDNSLIDTWEMKLNKEAKDKPHYLVLQILLCFKSLGNAKGYLIRCAESPTQTRLRWQQSFSPKSFHSAIVNNKINHVQVTAYDVAIGRGEAVGDPLFYKYLCAVADWRIKKGIDSDYRNSSVRVWEDVVKELNLHWRVERDWRVSIIEGNLKYYMSGILPNFLPNLNDVLTSNFFVCETVV